MKPLFKSYSLQNLFVLSVGYLGLIFLRKALAYWDYGEFSSSILYAGAAYCIFGFLLGLSPFSKLLK